MFIIQLTYLFTNGFKMSKIWVKWFEVIIRLIRGIIKWVNLGQIRVMRVDPKIIYLLNGTCKTTQIWPKPNYIQPKLMKTY